MAVATSTSRDAFLPAQEQSGAADGRGWGTGSDGGTQLTMAEIRIWRAAPKSLLICYNRGLDYTSSYVANFEVVRTKGGQMGLKRASVRLNGTRNRVCNLGSRHRSWDTGPRKWAYQMAEWRTEIVGKWQRAGMLTRRGQGCLGWIA